MITPVEACFRKIRIKIQQFSVKKMRLKISPAKWRPFGRGLNMRYRFVATEYRIWSLTDATTHRQFLVYYIEIWNVDELVTCISLVITGVRALWTYTESMHLISFTIIQLSVSYRQYTCIHQTPDYTYDTPKYLQNEDMSKRLNFTSVYSIDSIKRPYNQWNSTRTLVVI